MGETGVGVKGVTDEGLVFIAGPVAGFIALIGVLGFAGADCA